MIKVPFFYSVAIQKKIGHGFSIIFTFYIKETHISVRKWTLFGRKFVARVKLHGTFIFILRKTEALLENTKVQFIFSIQKVMPIHIFRRQGLLLESPCVNNININNLSCQISYDVIGQAPSWILIG
jgi:hypothetical protein